MPWQRDLAFSHWRLAQHGNQPRFHWQEVVSILRELEKQGRLAPTDQKWLRTLKKTSPPRNEGTQLQIALSQKGGF
jgi:hypothetical protein